MQTQKQYANNLMKWAQTLGSRLRQRSLACRDWRECACAAALVTIALAAILHAQRYAGPTIDDAFITFRHSLNLVRGNGFTCNVGERIEGTSSPLFALIMTLPIVFGAEPYRAATVIGQGCFAGCTLVAYLSIRSCLRDESSRFLGLGAAALVAASPTLAFHSQTGMETLPFCLLLVAGLWLQIPTVLEGERSRAWAWAMGAAALMRPEGFAYFLVFWVVAMAKRSTEPNAWHAGRRELLAFASVFLLYVAFRLAYFGRLVPNSVIAKSGHMESFSTMNPWGAVTAFAHGEGTQMFLQFANRHLVASVLSVGCVLLARTRYAGILIALVTATCVGLVTWNGGDWMPHDRLLCPSMVPLVIAFALGLRGFLFHREQRTWGSHAASYLVAALAIVLSLRSFLQPFPVAATALTDTAKMREIGRRLATVARPSDLLASELAGVLPYYWGVATLDMYGLCDEHIARHGKPHPDGVGRTAPEYVMAKRPTFYAFSDLATAAAFFQEHAFAPHRQDYYIVQYPHQYMVSFSAGSPPSLLVRKDRPDAQKVAAALAVRLVDAETELRRLGYSP